jgi:hypothetical protein
MIIFLRKGGDKMVCSGRMDLVPKGVFCPGDRVKVVQGWFFKKCLVVVTQTDASIVEVTLDGFASHQWFRPEQLRLIDDTEK